MKSKQVISVFGKSSAEAAAKAKYLGKISEASEQDLRELAAVMKDNPNIIAAALRFSNSPVGKMAIKSFSK